VTARAWHIESGVHLTNMCAHMSRVLCYLLPQAGVRLRWAQTALHTALHCNNRHLAGRSFQVPNSPCPSSNQLSHVLQILRALQPSCHGVNILKRVFRCSPSSVKPLPGVDAPIACSPRVLMGENLLTMQSIGLHLVLLDSLAATALMLADGGRVVGDRGRGDEAQLQVWECIAGHLIQMGALRHRSGKKL